MKIGDNVTYKVGGKIHYAKIVWISNTNATVETEQGTRDNLPISQLKLA